ncbi:MAG: NADH-quinone oxidoreductase subunit J [Lentimonas sp.]|jgi:NADH-quinone oxidoreductase subunit J
MLDILFYVFSTIILIAALVMVLSPNAVNCSMAMIVSFVATAALFVLLESYFLAILQILVYAGAVMVLFLFIIMLLDVDKGEPAFPRDKMTLIGSFFGFSLLAVLVVSTFSAAHLPEPGLFPVLENPTGVGEGIPFTTSAKSFGYSLFSKYMLPFQVTGFLLLAAMIGVIVVSKKQAAPETP